MADPKNRNIALTGRYGSGKSSILDRFLEEEERMGRRKAVRISINTLGPDDNEDMTNRIQKELVKQLVYRAGAGTIRRSRFARQKELTWWRSLRDAAVVGVVIVGLLWLFKIRPDPNAVGTGHVALSAVGLLILAILALWVVRWVVGNRLVSQFSTGGASISFEKQTESYFDEYLDEIVAFFDATDPDLVVFEDLDRFDNPQIFDSLRELNNLINASSHWRDRNQPLRFIYAIKDSLFEKLGEDSPDSPDKKTTPVTHDQTGETNSALPAAPPAPHRPDAAATAVERANRTKFFEIVVPIVPFLSHNNARDLLQDAIDELGLPPSTEIHRELVDLVARHTTDMRLMTNICNEFVVFAQRLLWIDTPTPGMTADDVFALVVYKNFHLADFERLAHRGSALDALELKRQNLVRESIEQLQRRKSDLTSGINLHRQQESLAHRLGVRLMILAARGTNHTISALEVGQQSHEPDSVYQPSFWRDVAQTRTLRVQLLHRSGHNGIADFDEDRLVELFTEGLDPDRWREFDPAEVVVEREAIDRNIALLRGADFSDLAKTDDYSTDGKPFDEHIESTLLSGLARDLVRRGFVNRYYAEYSAVFYGRFVGVDVANFFRNSVWPNEMAVQATFTTPNAVPNILEQAPTGFTSSRSALNIQVVDYLLEHRSTLAAEVVTFLVSGRRDDTAAFLDAYLNDSSSRRVKLVECLAAHPWHGLFDHLARDASVPDEETRTTLLDVALLNAKDAHSYEISDQSSELLVERHTRLHALTDDHDAETRKTVFGLAQRSKLVVPSLRPLSRTIRPLFVDADAYALTPDNIRCALEIGDDEPITLDRIVMNDAIWHRCRNDLDAYLDMLDRDVSTPHAVQTSELLAEIISEQHDAWSKHELARVLGSSAPTAMLTDISQVPQDVWPTAATACRIAPSVANISAYSAAFGVDEHLSKVLMAEPENPVVIEGVESAEPDVVHAVLVAILNASRFLTSSSRVSLALQLEPEPAHETVEASELEPVADHLLADLLGADLIPDTAATFAHFLTAGWSAVSPAFAISTAAQEFLTPDLVSGHVLDLLTDAHVPEQVKDVVVANLAEYVPDGDEEALSEAVSFAHAHQTRLPLQQLERAAPYVADPEHIVSQLAALGNELGGGDALRILSLLGGDYTGFSGGSGHRFDLAATASNKAVLDHLRQAGLVKLPRGGARGRKKVELV